MPAYYELLYTSQYQLPFEGCACPLYSPLACERATKATRNSPHYSNRPHYSIVSPKTQKGARFEHQERKDARDLFVSHPLESGDNQGSPIPPAPLILC